MPKDLNLLSSYQYHLPEELIAQHPIEPRDDARLMVIDRTSGNITQMKFRELQDFLQSGDSLVFNDTKVIPARLIGNRPTGGAVELFLVRQRELSLWEVMANPGRKLKNGSRVIFGEDFSAEIIETLPDGLKLVRFFHKGPFPAVLEQYGHIPLPPYIQRENDLAIDKERYQTVYAAHPGAVAAPTAGLHFTKDLLDALNRKGIEQTRVTLHVGLGTFRPVQVEDIRHHVMHKELAYITQEAAATLNRREASRRQICVGTTTCRVLESAATEKGVIVPGDYDTAIFIYPGYQFRYIQSLLTNFHLPGSTLLVLVCAFGGYDLMMEVYARAVKEKYRFFSYGDAMLLL